ANARFAPLRHSLYRTSCRSGSYPEKLKRVRHKLACAAQFLTDRRNEDDRPRRHFKAWSSGCKRLPNRARNKQRNTSNFEGGSICNWKSVSARIGSCSQKYGSTLSKPLTPPAAAQKSPRFLPLSAYVSRRRDENSH